VTFPRVPIKRVARIVGGSTPPAADDNWDGDVNWLTPTDISACHGGAVGESARKLTRVGLAACSAVIAPAGSVVVTTRAPIGNVALTTVPSATNQGCRTIIPGPRLDPRFLRYQLQVRVADLQARGTGTTFQELSGSALGMVDVSLPPLDVQRAIADFLDRECARLAGLERELQAQEDLLRSLLVSRRWELLSRYERSTTIGRITDCLDGLRIPLNAEERARREGPYPYWGANSIQGFVDDYLFDEPLVLIGEDGAPFFDDRRDVAWTVSGKVWVNNHAHVLRTRDGWLEEFVAEALNAVDYSQYITGATRDKLTQADLRAIRVPAIEIAEQERIVAELSRLRAKVEAATSELSEFSKALQRYRDALITEAVTGKLDVAEASEGRMEERLHEALEQEPAV